MRLLRFFFILYLPLLELLMNSISIFEACLQKILPERECFKGPLHSVYILCPSQFTKGVPLLLTPVETVVCLSLALEDGCQV